VKVLLYAAVDLSLPGGLETHVRELHRYLVGRGHEVDVFGRPDRLPGFRMVGEVDPARYDVLHHHGGVWPRRLEGGARYVRTFHFCVGEKMSVYLRMRRYRTLVNLPNWMARRDEGESLRRAGRSIAVSARLRDELARHHGADPSRIVVIPNGGGFGPPAEPRAALRARYGIAPEIPVLLTIGRDDFVKGLDLLERALRRARALPPGLVWVRIGGSAPSRAVGRIVTGPIPHAEAMSWIHAADVGAFPSYYEGGGIALLDMLAGGLYSLAHDVGVTAEVIRPGQNGEILACDADAWARALERTLAHPPPRPVGGLSDDYRWDAVCARVEVVYREAMARA
jgi:glycosyltransferase involved in cell wall biosynthesis